MLTDAHALPEADRDRLLQAVLELSCCHDEALVMRIVRTAARQLLNAQGATFIPREGDQIFYADEDAVAPL